jgi:hypothetical protein
MRSITRRLGSLAAVATFTLGFAAAAPAQADTVVSTRSVLVCEKDTDVNTGVLVRPGDRVTINTSGTIWAGMWFSGRNDAAGWTQWADSAYPLPQARRYSLLTHLNGSYKYAGNSADFRHNALESYLHLRINDNVPANGDGCFTATVRIWR